ncbi:mannonate dehydratase [Lichenihabitans sp. Uapishka_5]|uniref:mannonate dehydratase n=1 Tax=Lichenihabitans sp. Uapishka_5 TaxID=3037302 RepID=UPI0029E8005C|nr:mannonate dehydratase [Lichenihabitans sp. Uapishka_5]MDX7952222.1 mannonate dehydratase [Lichenihabitans sp. Uapishka_5]
MLQSWRWFGPNDPVTLSHARQAGVDGIVTALHEIYDGRVWTPEQIAARRAQVEAAGLRWAVCESIPVHSSIKLRQGPWRRYTDAWKDSLANLGRGGVPVVCYNFMPVVDWTRTDLRYPTARGGLALRFDMAEFVAYDAFVLKRRGAEADYPAALLETGSVRLAGMDADAVARLETTVIAGLPGKEDTHSRESIRAAIAEFDGVSPAEAAANLDAFLREVVPVAAEVGVRLAIHPDDPPFPLFGLPRVVSTAADARRILDAVDHPANGLTLCIGSYGSRPDNDLPGFVREFGPRVNFAHLRNTTRDPDGSFTEAEHLGGDSDMVGIILGLVAEERRRQAEGRADAEIPMRPDHGHLLIDDIGKATNPGYSCIGRLKGLAEIRGVMAAAAHLPA